MPLPNSEAIISAEALQAKFNQGDYWGRVKRGELRARPVVEGRAGRGHALGSVSQMVEYRDRAGVLVALVHQIVRPDGTLGGSGQPDPKVLIERGIKYTARFG